MSNVLVPVAGYVNEVLPSLLSILMRNSSSSKHHIRLLTNIQIVLSLGRNCSITRKGHIAQRNWQYMQPYLFSQNRA